MCPLATIMGESLLSFKDSVFDFVHYGRNYLNPGPNTVVLNKLISLDLNFTINKRKYLSTKIYKLLLHLKICISK